MMINPLHDAETVRQQKNLTESQRKNTLSTREGVLVNNCVKDKDCSLSETKDTFMIADNVPLPRGLYQDNKIVDKKLLPLSSIALGVMSSVALLTAFINRSAKASVGLAKEKWLPSVTRNVQLSKETYQVIYQMVQNPNRKTFIAGAGVLALSAMAFMGKTFFDGFKDVWVKRKESDIQKNLQENLVSVETESFSGKMQIIRSMLSKYSADFEKYIKSDNEKILPNFGKNKYLNPNFTSDEKIQKNKSKSIVGNVILGLATITGIDASIYEAAAVDGASKTQCIFKVTLPMLKNTIIMLTIMSVGKIFNGDFGMIYAMVGSNSILYPTTDVIDTYLFRQLLENPSMGQTAAVGLIQSILGFGFVVLCNKVANKWSPESALF